jgi:hypothetical protein
MNYLHATAERIRRSIPATALPEDAEALLLLYAVLAHAKGRDTAAEDVHDAWTAWMLLRGEDHESMIPFSELSPDVQAEDLPFLRAIHQAATSEER